MREFIINALTEMYTVNLIRFKKNIFYYLSKFMKCFLFVLYKKKLLCIEFGNITTNKNNYLIRKSYTSITSFTRVNNLINCTCSRLRNLLLCRRLSAVCVFSAL